MAREAERQKAMEGYREHRQQLAAAKDKTDAQKASKTSCEAESHSKTSYKSTELPSAPLNIIKHGNKTTSSRWAPYTRPTPAERSASHQGQRGANLPSKNVDSVEGPIRKMLGDVPIKDVNKKINQDVKGLDKLPQKAPAPTKERSVSNTARDEKPNLKRKAHDHSAGPAKRAKVDVGHENVGYQGTAAKRPEEQKRKRKAEDNVELPNKRAKHDAASKVPKSITAKPMAASKVPKAFTREPESAQNVVPPKVTAFTWKKSSFFGRSRLPPPRPTTPSVPFLKRHFKKTSSPPENVTTIPTTSDNQVSTAPITSKDSHIEEPAVSLSPANGATTVFHQSPVSPGLQPSTVEKPIVSPPNININKTSAFQRSASTETLATNRSDVQEPAVSPPPSGAIRTLPTQATASAGAVASYTSSPQKPVSTPPHVNATTAAPSNEEGPSGSPAGLGNHWYACFGNAAVQALDTMPGFSAHFKSKAGDTVPMVDQYATENAHRLERRGTRHNSAQRDKLRAFLEEAASANGLLLGAYLGDLLVKLQTAKGTDHAPSSFLFMQACGGFIKDFDNVPMNGAGQNDCGAFIELLLGQLLNEETDGLLQGVSAATVVRDTLNLGMSTTLDCKTCEFSKTMPSNGFHKIIRVDLPESSDTAYFQDLVDSFSAPQKTDWRCDLCKTASGNVKSEQLTQLGEYAFVNIPRATYYDGSKNLTKVAFPQEPVEIKVGDKVKVYEAVAIMEHLGTRSSSGHWVCTRKDNGQWYRCSDEDVRPVSMAELVDHCEQASVVLLKRVP